MLQVTHLPAEVEIGKEKKMCFPKQNSELFAVHNIYYLIVD